VRSSNINWFHFAAPQRFYPLAGKLIPWFALAGCLLAAYGMYLGLWVAPTDATQGQAYRIIFVHVPTAWMSMVIYVAMAGWAGAGLVFNSRR
jgi:heme exporter protein C